MQHEDEHKLIGRILRGDAQAERRLYERYMPGMYRLCLRYAGDAAEAQDMLQEGFLRVFAHIAQFKGAGSLEGWIRRVMLHAALAVLRRRKDFEIRNSEYAFCPPDDESPEWGDAPENAPEYDYREVIDAIQRLPPGYRAVISLYAIEGYTHEQIAEALGINAVSSRTQLHKARKRLIQMLKTQTATDKLHTTT